MSLKTNPAQTLTQTLLLTLLTLQTPTLNLTSILFSS